MNTKPQLTHQKGQRMFPYSINSAGIFHADGTEFHIDMSPKNRRRSKPDSFTIVKNTPYLNIYGALSETIKPRTILELGIYQVSVRCEPAHDM